MNVVLPVSRSDPGLPIHLRGVQSEADIWEFVASTEAVDRYGDVISADAWDLKFFRKNPIALWQHSGSTPIGTWSDIRVEDRRLVARLNLAKPGTSTVIDMLRGLVEQRILRAVSVGFLPKKWEDLDPNNPRAGVRYTKVELLEISLVSIPANQEALAVARAVGASEDLISKVFSLSGQTAHSPPLRGTKTMNLAERITAREANLTKLKDQLVELTAKDDPTDAELIQIEELTGQVDVETKSLETLRRAQTALASSSRPVGDQQGDRLSAPSTIQSRGAKDPAALFVRAAVVLTRSFVERRSVDEIIRSNFGGSKELDTIVRAAVAPAQTAVTGWAAELVGETTGAFVDIVRPGSIFFNLPMLSLNFAGKKIKLPTRGGGSLAGSFVGETQPIPVKKLTMASSLLEPHKLGVITTFSREIAAMSDPAIEPLLRNIMVADTRDTIDTLFLDNTAAVAGVRPAGLQQLAGANTAASAGTTLANVLTDLRTAVTALTNANMGASPVWIMNKQRALSLSLMTNAAGAFMFRDEIAQGMLLGIPLLASTSVPAGVVFLVDAEELASAMDGSPQIDLSEQATLHMEDTTPAPIVGGAGAGTPANPVQSLFQTASIALRLLWDLTWAQRRAGSVYTITGVSW